MPHHVGAEHIRKRAFPEQHLQLFVRKLRLVEAGKLIDHPGTAVTDIAVAFAILEAAQQRGFDGGGQLRRRQRRNLVTGIGPIKR